MVTTYANEWVGGGEHGLVGADTYIHYLQVLSRGNSSTRDDDDGGDDGQEYRTRVQGRAYVRSDAAQFIKRCGSIRVCYASWSVMLLIIQ